MWKKLPIVLAVFLCATVLFLYPLLRTITTHTTSVNDGQLITWLTHQSANALSREEDFYNWPFFHPYTYTVTYSDPFLSSAFFLLIIRNFTQNIVLQYNLLLLLSLIGNFWTMFWLSHVLWKRVATSTLVAVVFTFSFTLYQFIPHLHSYMIWGLPLGLGALIKYIGTKQWQWLIVFMLAFLIQMLNAPLTGYFFIAIATAYVISEKKLLQLVTDTNFLASITLAVGLSAWYYLPYIFTAESLNAVRTLKDTAHFSYGVEKIFSLEICSILIIFLLSWMKVLWRKKEQLTLAPSLEPQTIAAIIFVGILCMVGPVLRFDGETVRIFGLAIPLPYAVFYYIVPGLQAFRSVSRWAIVLHFGLALAVGWVVQKLHYKVLYYAFFSLYLSLTFIQYQKQMYLYEVSNSEPAVYTLARESNGEVLVEFPMYLWDMGEVAGKENSRLVWQLSHKKILFNGVSGLTPPERENEIHYFYQNFPDTTSIAALKKSGVQLVIIHYDEYKQLPSANNYYGLATQNPERIKQKITQNSYLVLVGCTTVPADCLYLLE